MAGEQHLGHRAALPVLGPRVMGIFQKPCWKLSSSSDRGVADDAGQQAHAGVEQRDRRRLAAREHEIAEADLLEPVRLDHALVDAFETAAEQPHAGSARERRTRA